MGTDRDKLAEQVALFRYGLIADLIHQERGVRGLYAALNEKAEKRYEIPGTLRSRVAAETIRGWLRQYRRGGFDALVPKGRRDQGHSRRIPQPVADVLVSIKEDKPALSIEHVIAAARLNPVVPATLPLAPSTVHRLLVRHGLTAKKSQAAGEPKDRRRFSYRRAGELWMSDVMHGPAVVGQGRRKHKTYLIAFIDDATRVVPYAAFASSENTREFMPVFKQAILRRGLPKRLFVDNGAAYRSQHLQLVTARLGVTLIHARVRDAAAKGKQERWFRTVRMQLLPRLSADDLSSLEALNRRLWVYVEQEYHQSPHRGLDGETPLERWAGCSEDVRYPGPETDLEALFLNEQRRKVRKDRTLSLDGHVYEVDSVLVGETVALRFDPARPGRDIEVWHRGQRVQTAKLVDTYANCFIKRNRDAAPDALRLSDFQNEDANDGSKGVR